MDQRTEVEKFFIESLEHVKSNMVQQQEEKRKTFFNEYNRKLKMVLDTKGLSLAAFRDNFKPLIPLHDYISVEKEESVFKNTQLKTISMEELSWSDRERVLRLLFAKMNGVSGGQPRKQKVDVAEKKDDFRIPAVSLESSKVELLPSILPPITVNE